MIPAKRRRRGLVATLAASALLVGPAGAQWSSPATGPATAKSATLAPPTSLAAVCAGGLLGLGENYVRVTWAAASPASPWPVGYVVLVTGAQTLSYPVTTLIKDVGPLSSGVYHFTVRATTGTWWRSDAPSPISRSIGSFLGIPTCN